MTDSDNKTTSRRTRKETAEKQPNQPEEMAVTIRFEGGENSKQFTSRGPKKNGVTCMLPTAEAEALIAKERATPARGETDDHLPENRPSCDFERHAGAKTMAEALDRLDQEDRHRERRERMMQADGILKTG